MLELEERQVIVEPGAGELRVDADLADPEDLALSRIGLSQVEVSEAGRVLVSLESNGETKCLAQLVMVRNYELTSLFFRRGCSERPS